MNDSQQNFVHNMWNLYALIGFAAKASWFSSIWKDNSATRMYKVEGDASNLQLS